MPRRPEVDQHPAKQQIIRALVRGDTYRAITEHYGISRAALTRYLNTHLVQRAAKARAQMELDDGANVLEILKVTMARMQKLYDACDEYLTDPWNPERYDLGPRAGDVTVIYRGPGDDAAVGLRKARLSELLTLLEDEGLRVIHTEWRHADPRELVIKTANAIGRKLELAAKLLGVLVPGEEKAVRVTINQVWIDMRAIIMKATEGYPEVRERIAQGLLEEGNRQG